jgi:hypothetical protein
MNEYEIPEMPDYCHCSSNGECAYCLSLPKADAYSVTDGSNKMLFVGTLEQCRDYHAKNEVARREHLWVKAL